MSETCRCGSECELVTRGGCRGIVFAVDGSICPGHRCEGHADSIAGTQQYRGPIEHALKTAMPFFMEAVAKLKPFEYRKDDRGFCVGDVLLLREWDGSGFTGREAKALVTYILRAQSGACPVQILDGYCIMGITMKAFRPGGFK